MIDRYERMRLYFTVLPEDMKGLHMKSNRLTTLLALFLIVFLWQSLDPVSWLASAKGKKGKAVAAKKQETKYPPEFYDAIKMVYDQKYHDAFEIFDRLDRTGYCRDKTHYYMALCLHNQNQTQAAAQHYQVVYNYSKDPQLKYLAAVGYQQVAKYAANRTYNGQGNIFASMSRGGSNAAGPWGGGGGGGGGGGRR